MKKILSLIMLLVLSSCASTKMNKLPETSPFPIIRETSILGMDGIFIRTAVFTLNKVYDGKEYFVIPEYHRNDTKIKITYDTVGIFVVVNVRNTNHLNYSLWETYEVQDHWNTTKYENLAYKGNDSGEVKLTVPIYEKIKTLSYRIELRDRNGNKRAFLGSLNYKR